MVGTPRTLVVCAACHVHFKRTETACPHCDAPATTRGTPLAAALAMGVGMALSGCSSDGGDDGADDVGDVGEFGDAAAYGVPATESFDDGDDLDMDTGGTTGGTDTDPADSTTGDESVDGTSTDGGDTVGSSDGGSSSGSDSGSSGSTTAG